jgi:isoleucyl-tRNA synthetase
VKIENSENVKGAIESFGDYVASQVLANSIELVEKVANPIELDFDDFKVNIEVTKA